MPLQDNRNPFAPTPGGGGNPYYTNTPPPSPRPSLAQFLPQQGQGQRPQQPQFSQPEWLQAWQPPQFNPPQFDYSQPAAIATPDIPTPDAGFNPLQSFTPPTLNVSSGISQPQLPGLPQAPSQPDFGGSPGLQAGAGANFASSIGPMLAELLGSFYQQAAPIQSNFQQAQANSGLGWMGLGSGLANQQQEFQTRQQSGLMALLQDLFSQNYA